VDVDGSGSISSSELHRVVELATGQAPSESDLATLMRKMDANNDGTISWEEFCSAITEWLAEDEKTSAQGTGDEIFGKRKAPLSGRVEIHRRIHRFFKQFQRHKDFDQMRQTFVNEVLTNSRAGLSPEAILGAQECIARLDRSHAIIAQLSDVAQGIQSNDVDVAVSCTQALADLLSVTEVFATPNERYEAGEFLMTVFNLVAEAGVIARVVNFMGVEESPQLQYEAARALTYYCPGPRIPHTPPESIFYPEKMHQKQQLFAYSVHVYIAQMLASPNLSCREQACNLIAALASHDAAARNFLYECGIFNSLCEQIDPQDLAPKSYLVKIARALSIFCGVTHTDLLAPDQLEAALPRLAVLFSMDDQDILRHVTAGLAYVFPGIEIDSTIHERIVALLSVQIDEIILSTLVLLNSIASVDKDAVEVWVNMGLLERLSEMLYKSTSTAIRTEICTLFGAIAIRHGLALALIEQNVFPALFQVLLTDDSLRGRVIRVIRAIVTTPQPKDVKVLVEQYNVVKTLSLSLALFKTWDEALMDLYSATAPAYNYSFVSDVLATLNDLIDVGERLLLQQTAASEADSTNINPFTKYFGMQLLESVFNVMRIFSTECAADPTIWTTAPGVSDMAVTSSPRLASKQPQISVIDSSIVSNLEDYMKRLVVRIRDMHMRAHSQLSQLISSRVATEEKQYFDQLEKSRTSAESERTKRARSQRSLLPSLGAQNMDGDMVTVKFILQLSSKADDVGDNRVATVNRGISLHDFMRVIQQKYGRRYVPQMTDQDGDLITIDTQDALTDLLSRAVPGERLKIHLLNPALTNPGLVVRRQESGHYSAALERIETKDQLNKQRSQIVQEFYQATEFSKDQLHKLFNVFLEASKDGFIDRESFKQCIEKLKLPGFETEEAIDILFKGFDKQNQGLIDVRHFIAGLAAINSGSYDTRIEFLFRAYDLDGSGTLSRDEIASCARVLLESRGGSIDPNFLEAFIEAAFKHDSDGDGELNFQEFKRAMLNEKAIMAILWSQIKPEGALLPESRKDHDKSHSNKDNKDNKGGKGHQSNNNNHKNKNNNNNNNRNNNHHSRK